MSEEVETGQDTVETVTQTPVKIEQKARSTKSRDDIEAELMETIAKNHKYRNERQEDRTRIRELEPQAQRAVELEDQLTKLNNSHRVEIAMARLEALAIREGIVDTDALKLVDASSLKFNEDGKPENLADVLADFKTAKPHFFGASNSSTSSVAKVPSPLKTELDAKTMPKQEFDKLWDSY